MKVMIAENGLPALEELSYLLKQEDGLEVCAAVSSGVELLRLADELQPDAVFLSTSLEDFDGLTAARMLAGKSNGPVIVMLAEDGRYAAEAFTLHAADYLVKPYHANRVRESVGRIRDRIGCKHPSAKENILPNLLIYHEGKVVVVQIESIIAIVKDEKNVAIHTKQGKCYSSKSTLQELEEKLKGFPFFRTHRSYLINLGEVEELIPWFNGAFNLKMKSASAAELKVPVSRDAAKELFRRLGGE